MIVAIEPADNHGQSSEQFSREQFVAHTYTSTSVVCNVRTNAAYEAGELEVILSLAPTHTNIRWLSQLLKRSERSIEIVYKIAFEHGPFGQNADIQQRKIIEAKKRL
jgi:hypothetical protein